MSSPAPMMASETTAARLLDLRTPQFLKLVDDGHLPPGREIAPGSCALGYRNPEEDC